MATRASLFLVLCLLTTPLSRESPRELIVWNVGQGQWVTLADDGQCWHFDAGGEFAPWAQIRARCRGLVNRVVFSHWDQDHVGFAARLAALLPGACAWLAPEGAANARKRRVVNALPACAAPVPFRTWVDESARDANSRSRVSVIAATLVPGDAPRPTERRFVGISRDLARVRWLILGHHGSATSTSIDLLNALQNLRLAIASARRARYGHPHAETLARLAARRVPVVSTDDWGTIHIRMD